MDMAPQIVKVRSGTRMGGIVGQIDLLVSELAAIELWDILYLRNAQHSSIGSLDQTAFEARQARRQKIQQDIQILHHTIHN